MREKKKLTLKDKIVFLKSHRISHTPPAQHLLVYLKREGLNSVALEYSNTKQEKIFGEVWKWRWAHPFARCLPKKLRAAGIWVATLFRLFTLIKLGQRPSLLIANGLTESAITYLIYRLTQVNYVVYVHEIYDEDDLTGLPRFFFKFEKKFLGSAKFLIFSDKGRIKIYKERYSLGNKIFFIPNCPPKLEKLHAAIDLRSKYSLPKDAFIVGYLGGIGDLNASLEFIRAAALTPQICFIFWGWINPEYQKEILRVIEQHGLENRVILAGEIPSVKKYQYLRACQLSLCYYKPTFLRTRFQVYASNKIMESLAVGVPVLVSNQADFRAFLKKYKVGWTLPSLEIFDIEKTLIHISTLPISTIKSYAGAARKTHLNDLHFENHAETFLKTLKSFLEKETTRRRNLGSPRR